MVWLLKRVENMVAVKEKLLLLPQCFQKLSAADVSKRVNITQLQLIMSVHDIYLLWRYNVNITYDWNIIKP